MKQLAEKTSKVKWSNQEQKAVGRAISGCEVIGKATIECSPHGFTKLIITNRTGIPQGGYAHEREDLKYTIKNAESALNNLI